MDPRALTAAALKAARHRGVDISSGTAVTECFWQMEAPSASAPSRTNYFAPAIVNCAGAWAGQLPPHRFPTRPVKGQMLSLAGASRDLLRHVIRAPEIYLVPRSDGRILVGSHRRRSRIRQTNRRGHDSAHAPGGDPIWFPLWPRPACWKHGPDCGQGLPITCRFSGATRTPGYFVATGHFRDGILLTPVHRAGDGADDHRNHA